MNPLYLAAAVVAFIAAVAGTQAFGTGDPTSTLVFVIAVVGVCLIMAIDSVAKQSKGGQSGG